MKVKGVNLGNWLVLEKWMSPALFDGTTAEDEYYLPRQLSKEVYEARIKIHRSEYITERDFVTIKSMGMEAVRIITTIQMTKQALILPIRAWIPDCSR